jgi:hypothetical protein
MAKTIVFPKSRFVDVFVNPSLPKPMRALRCDDVRSRLYRLSGRSFCAIAGLRDSLLLNPVGYRVECKSHVHAVRVVRAITMSIPTNEAGAVVKGRRFVGFQQDEPLKWRA